MNRNMKTFKVIFTGRSAGAVEKNSTFVEYVKAENKDAALRQIYEKYRDVKQVQIEAWKQDRANYGAGRPPSIDLW